MERKVFTMSKETITARFEKFHNKNPHIYKHLLDMTNQLKEKGHDRIGISMLYEVLRWKSMIRTTGEDYKLSNDFRAHYARKIMNEHPELDGIFQLREQTSE